MLQNMGMAMALTTKPTPPVSPVVTFDPEAGLILTTTISAGAVDTELDPFIAQDITFAVDVTFPTNPVEGVLLEHGGTGIGHIVVLRDGGSTLRLRAGDGAAPYNADNTAVLDVTDFPRDGLVHTVVWDIRVGMPGRIRLWIDGILAGEATTSAWGLENDRWSGGASGSFATGVNADIAGEPGGVGWPAPVIGALRCYVDQLVAAGG